MTNTLLVFTLDDFALAFAISSIREIREPLESDLDLLDVLGLKAGARGTDARTIVLEDSGAALCLSARPEILETASESVVDVPSLVTAHPSVTGIVLHEERVLVLLDAECAVAGAAP